MTCVSTLGNPTHKARHYVVAHACAMLMRYNRGAVFPRVCGGSVVELGCHNGVNLKHLWQVWMWTHATGVDHSIHAIRQAGAIGLPDCDFQHKTIAEWVEEPTTRVDLILCSWILVHVKPIMNAVLDKIAESTDMLVTFENELQCRKNFAIEMGKRGFSQKFGDTFKWGDNVQVLRGLAR